MKKETENKIGVVCSLFCALLACISLLLFVCWLIISAASENMQIKDELAFCKSINGHYGERKCFKDGVVLEYRK